ncbi:MAG TPA: MFS transporter, partial [Candidatus Limnocylindrales bacterium]|nr:MFS transporter [Candidatus Limnocylindrales bacterium]
TTAAEWRLRMASMTASRAAEKPTYRLPFVISASAAGTIIEWYDFYLYGVLAAFFSTQFFPKDNPTAALLASLATFGAGFAVRPFGAAVFGRIGDIVGRKFTFLVTITVMGVSTALVGLLPTFAQIGILAPLILVALRLAQGLALGGEYGGAAIYVAEHSNDADRGKNTSWIQTTATLGLLMALVVIFVTRAVMPAEVFADWGWRIPFLLSAVLVALALYIRLRLQETPLFTRLKDQGKSSRSPWRESFGNAKNAKLILLALFGATAGQAVVWYQGQFQALFFLGTNLGVKYQDAYLIVGTAIVLATPFFYAFGRLSDRIGRKKVILSGALIAAISYVPIYMLMIQFAHPQGTLSTVGATAGKYVDAAGAVTAAQPEILPLIALVWIQVVFVTMVYGPIAAFLVEYFPARIRYTSLSIPYHLGNGWFGGFLPLIGSALILSTGSLLASLAYPIIVALITVVIGGLYIRESRHVKIWDEVGGHDDDLAAAPADAAAQPATTM